MPAIHRGYRRLVRGYEGEADFTVVFLDTGFMYRDRLRSGVYKVVFKVPDGVSLSFRRIRSGNHGLELWNRLAFGPVFRMLVCSSSVAT